MERVRLVKRDASKGFRERIEPKEPMSGPSPMIPMEKPEFRLAIRAEGDDVYVSMLRDDEIAGYRRKYGSDEMRSALRSPHLALGLIERDRLVKGMLMKETLEDLKKLRGALEARSRRVKDRGIKDSLPFLIPRITLEDLKKAHGIIFTDVEVDFDALIISKDGEAVRPKEDKATRILEALIRIAEVVRDERKLENDLSIALDRYHANDERILEVLSIFEAPMERIPEIVRTMKSFGLKAAPEALVATMKDRLKEDIDSLLAALSVYKEISVDRLAQRISEKALKILIKAPEEKAREARRMLRDLMPEVAKEAAKVMLKEKDVSDDFASELASFVELSKQEALEILKRAEKLNREKASAKIYVIASPSEEEVKELKRSPEYALKVAKNVGKDAVSLFHRLLGTRLADQAAEEMVLLGLIDEDLKSRMLKASKRNPLRVAEIAKHDKKLFKRLIDSIYEGLDSTKFSLILAENLDVLERDRVDERIPKRLENHEPSERLIDVVTKLKAERASMSLASYRASRERRELVNRIVEGSEKKLAKRIVDEVTTEDLLPLLALKPHLAAKRFKEGLLSVEKFEKIEHQVLEELGFDEILELIRLNKFSKEGLRVALEAAVKKIDSRKRVLELAEFAKSYKHYERILPRIASHAKLLKPEPSEEFANALRMLGEAFAIEYVREKYELVLNLLKERKHRYVGMLLVLADPKRFEEHREELDGAEILTPEVQVLVPEVTKRLALSGKLKPAYPYEVFRHIGKLPEYLERLLKGEKVKIDAKDLDSVGEYRILATAIRNASYVTKSGPVALAHAIGALRIFVELRDVEKRIKELLGKPGELQEISVKLPPGFFSGKAKRFAKDRELQKNVILHILEAPYLKVTEEGLEAIDMQRKVRIKRAKKKLMVEIKGL